MCCGCASCCWGIPGGGQDTTIGGIAGPDADVGWRGRNTRLGASLITDGTGWFTLYAITGAAWRGPPWGGPPRVGLAATVAGIISGGTTLGVAVSRLAP